MILKIKNKKISSVKLNIVAMIFSYTDEWIIEWQDLFIGPSPGACKDFMSYYHDSYHMHLSPIAGVLDYHKLPLTSGLHYI